MICIDTTTKTHILLFVIFLILLFWFGIWLDNKRTKEIEDKNEN